MNDLYDRLIESIIRADHDTISSADRAVEVAKLDEKGWGRRRWAIRNALDSNATKFRVYPTMAGDQSLAARVDPPYSEQDMISQVEKQVERYSKDKLVARVEVAITFKVK